jgi:hypothetical protein
VGVTKYGEEEVLEEKMKGDQLDRRRKEKGGLCVAFAIMRRLEDKKENGEDFSREATYILEMFGQVRQLKGTKRGTETSCLFRFFAKSFKLII